VAAKQNKIFRIVNKSNHLEFRDLVKGELKCDPVRPRPRLAGLVGPGPLQ
jgi:hypothetical protein